MRQVAEVGIVVPCLEAKYLTESLNSLQEQTVQGSVVVVHERSGDPEVVRISKEMGVEAVCNEGTGVAAARNSGISRLQTEWILAFDSDNVAQPTFLEQLLRAARRRKGVGIAYSRAVQFGDAEGLHPFVDRRLPGNLRGSNFIDASSLFARRAWAEAGGYDPAAQPVEDWDLWISIVERGWKIAYVPRPLFQYRVRADSQTRSSSDEDHRRARLYIRQKHPEFFSGPEEHPIRRAVAKLRRKVDAALE
jgi:cellulose synthase/poly-beta-1,6-N-acetylglucosamine synthase-like glycosyltransferase